MNKFIDISNIVLKTERLILRDFKQNDLLDFNEYAKVDGVGEMAGWPHHKSIEETQQILNKFLTNHNTFAITLNNKVIGSLGLENYLKNDGVEDEFLSSKLGLELGFALSKSYWGQGIMKEAIDSVIEYLFNNTDIDFILCGYYLFNNQSKRVQEKCGFKPYKLFTYHTALNTFEQGQINILLKEDYQKLNKK